MAEQNPDVAWAISDLKARLPAIQRRIDYYDGKHLSVLPPANTLSPLVASLLEDLADNLCDDVVDEAVDRLDITGWEADPNPDGPDRAALAQALWDANQGDLRAPDVHRDSWKAADGWAIADSVPVDPANPDGEVRQVWHRQDPRQMGCRYSTTDPGRIEVAYRLWQDGVGKRWRLNLYYDPTATGGARLERWASRGEAPGGGIPEPKAFQRLEAGDPALPDGDDGQRDWPRVPVFHFPADAWGRYGRSILSDVIPLQDLLNKSVADLVAMMEEAALPARFGTGIQAKIDPATGKELPVFRRARSMAEMTTVASKDAQFYQFDGQDPTGFLEVITHWRAEIARKGFLPPSSVDTTATTGQVSGLSLLVQEGRMVKRGKAGTRYNGAGWSALMAYMLTAAGVPTTPDQVRPVWGPVETRDEVARWELLMLKRDLGVPTEVLLVEGGYDAEDVERWLEDAAASAGGRVSAPGGGFQAASVTVPGVPGGFAVPAPPGQPAGADRPGLPSAP